MVSKALIHAYSPNQDDLINAVLARAFDGLATAGLDEASKAPPLPGSAANRVIGPDQTRA